PAGRAALFGIVQGGVYPDLREQCAVALKQMGFEGYGIGGLGIGETTEQMMEMTSSVTELLDDDRPRYLMGLGKPTDIVGAIGRGVDMFDCVVPTRNARNAMLFSDSGPMRMRNAAYADDPRPPVEGCGCPACLNHSRAYLRHLYNSGEHLAGVLGTIHNIHYYQSLVRRCREAIIGGRFSRFSDEYLSRYSPEHEDSE
ncbi:MAG: tRNA guanosine(34) transglycosylase Tgt, partial [Candidatus Brocadiia bacterium]